MLNPYSNQIETIKAAIGSILPTAHMRYTGKANTYASFMFYNSQPEVLASGMNHQVGVYGDIDLFSPTDPDSGLALQVINALLVAGIEVRGSRDGAYDADTKKFHKLIEFRIRVKR